MRSSVPYTTQAASTWRQILTQKNCSCKSREPRCTYCNNTQAFQRPLCIFYICPELFSTSIFNPWYDDKQINSPSKEWNCFRLYYSVSSWWKKRCVPLMFLDVLNSSIASRVLKSWKRPLNSTLMRWKRRHDRETAESAKHEQVLRLIMMLSFSPKLSLCLSIEHDLK